jgi:hypothetical protein
LASLLLILASAGFVAGGAGFLLDLDWWRTVVMVAAALSAATVILFWDGNSQYIIQKGLAGILLRLLVFG